MIITKSGRRMFPTVRLEDFTIYRVIYHIRLKLNFLIQGKDNRTFGKNILGCTRGEASELRDAFPENKQRSC